MRSVAEDNRDTVQRIFDELWEKELKEGGKFAPYSPTWVRAITEGVGIREGMRVIVGGYLLASVFEKTG